MVVNRSQGTSIIFLIDRLFLLVYRNSFSIKATNGEISPYVDFCS